MEYLVLTIQAPQHVNIWLKFTQLATDMDCHIQQARGLKLAGENAFVALVSGNWNTIAKLEASLNRLSKEEGVLVNTKRSKGINDQIQLLPYIVEVLGLDEIGMLANFCKFFSDEEISIENLKVESYISSATNAPMFSLKVSIGIPSLSNIGDLRERFILFCEDLNVDGAIEPDRR